jgi:hypothetical protein
MPKVAAPTLSRRALSRATLARQLLLERHDVAVQEAIARLAGMQAQVARPPFVGLWTRLARFERQDLLTLIHGRQVVRGTAMRGTLHLMTAEDFRAWRSPLQPMLTAGMKATLRDRISGDEVQRCVEVAREFLLAEPRPFNALRDHLVERFPDGDERAMGYAVRMTLPLVMVPDASPWGFPADAAFAVADSWMAEPTSPEDAATDLIRRYLAAFGPASVADAQAWSGLKGLKPVFEALRGELEAFRDERGRELFDLPGSPRPDEETPVPVRFLPDFDNLVLAHDDRSRVVPDEYRPRIVTRNLLVLATFLVDGVVSGTWKVERKGKKATLLVQHFEDLKASRRDELVHEGSLLLDFAEPDADRREVAFA